MLLKAIAMIKLYLFAFRWERAPTAKTVTKLLASTKHGEDGLQSAGTMGHTLAKALGELPEYSQGSSKLHPHHICIELDDMAKQSIGELFSQTWEANPLYKNACCTSGRWSSSLCSNSSCKETTQRR